MAALSTSTGSLHEHRDIRSESRGFKRDKDHNSKWAAGYRAAPGVSVPWTDPDPVPGPNVKVRPQKKFNEM
jgi:hypothetical protein